MLSSALKGAAGLGNNMNEKFGPRALCYGALFKSRYTKKSCILSHRNDQLLMTAGVQRKAFRWFNKMGFCNSYTKALRQNKLMSVNHDSKVKSWKTFNEEIYKNDIDNANSEDQCDIDLIQQMLSQILKEIEQKENVVESETPMSYKPIEYQVGNIS